MKMISMHCKQESYPISFVYEINSNSSENPNERLAMSSSQAMTTSSAQQSFKYWNPATIEEKFSSPAKSTEFSSK